MEKEFNLYELAEKFAGLCSKCPLHVNYYDYEDMEREVDYCAARYLEEDIKSHTVHFKLEPDTNKCPLKELTK